MNKPRLETTKKINDIRSVTPPSPKIRIISPNEIIPEHTRIVAENIGYSCTLDRGDFSWIFEVNRNKDVNIR